MNDFLLNTNSSLTEKDFYRLSSFIHSYCGIKMPLSKKTMLEARLNKRLRLLRMSSYSEYCKYLFSNGIEKNELINLINVITTNKTDFFREPEQFKILLKEVLPELTANLGIGIRRPLMTWSAGCSTGEEPYTLAMTLSEFSARCPGLGFNYTVLASDISTKVLDTARKAIYNKNCIEPIPDSLKQKYLLRNKDRRKDLFRIVPALRNRVRFRRLNFIDEDFSMREKMDIIFCRNVIIYFDKATQEKVINRFYTHLSDGGFMFLGHSETLNGMSHPFKQIVPTIYRKV